jgi:hypothetical protein
MNIRARIIEITDTQQITDTFRKREFVVEFAENPQYPEFIKFEMIQDKCDLLNNFQVGQEVEVHFNLKGRKWTDPQGQVKYFNSLQAWRVLDANAAGAQPAQGAAPQGGGAPMPTEEPQWNNNSSDEDELPF